jgi:hypothetical protein
MTAITVFALQILQQAINRLKPLYDRFIVRDNLITGKIKEVFAKPDGSLPMNVWFNPQFWLSLNLRQAIGLVSLAAFKIFTFPLGTWIGSFTLVMTYPLSHIIGNTAGLLIHPIMLFIANKGLNEFVVNKTTMTGFAIVMISLVGGVVGWYLVYIGGNPS